MLSSPPCSPFHPAAPLSIPPPQPPYHPFYLRTHFLCSRAWPPTPGASSAAEASFLSVGVFMQYLGVKNLSTAQVHWVGCRNWLLLFETLLSFSLQCTALIQLNKGADTPRLHSSRAAPTSCKGLNGNTCGCTTVLLTSCKSGPLPALGSATLSESFPLKKHK